MQYTQSSFDPQDAKAQYLPFQQRPMHHRYGNAGAAAPLEVGAETRLFSSALKETPSGAFQEEGYTAQQPNLAHRCARTFKYLIVDTWLPEVISWFFSFGCLVAVIVILMRWDNEPLPKFPYGITVGTLVVLFTTLSATALMIPVSQGISQLKWLYFTGHAKRIADLETFDQASRGIWGSIFLIFSPRLGKIPSLGSALTILVLAVNAVTQQTIRYAQYPVPDAFGTAAAPISNLFDAYTQPATEILISPVIDRATHGALLSGLFQDPKSELSFKAPRCSTGNCTWPRYQTLSICSSVSDVSDFLDVDMIPESGSPGNVDYIEKQLMIRLPGVTKFGVTLSTKGIWVVEPVAPMWIDNPAKSIMFANLENSTIADFFVVWNTFKMSIYDWPAVQARSNAVEINLHFCVQTLETKVRDGIATTHTASEPITAFKPNNGSERCERFYWDCISPAVVPGAHQQFGFARGAQYGLLEATSKEFSGRWIWEPGYDFFGSDRPETIGLKPIVDLLTNAGMSTNGLDGFARHDRDYMAKFSTFANNIAVSISNRMRSADNAGSIQGTATSIETKIQVSWPWISLLAFLVVGSLVFLVSVICMNRTQSTRLWRSSNIALLQAVDPSARPVAMYGIYDNDAMERNAAKTYFRLNKDDGVWKLVD